VLLATLLEEERRPADAFWNAPRIASRLADLEVRVRATGRLLPRAAASDVEELMARVRFVEITPESVGMLYVQPPTTLRTLDAIHLATLEYLNRHLARIPLASYDRRMLEAARAMGFDVVVP
jgi:predicted nucleic acid-binding protein